MMEGYLLNGRVIRAAKVGTVSERPAHTDTQESDDNNNNNNTNNETHADTNKQ